MNVLLAVSGGIDSMYLLERAPEFFPGASFAVAHCNFTLRGKESDDDEQFVVNACAQKGIRCFVKHFDTKTIASQKGISIEMAARELRYEWFAEICSLNNFDALAVAHNANDNAETLLLNLVRGTGTKGLRGMSHDSRQNSLRILRPMLGIERSQITRWMNENGLFWREDSSNAECEYKRNTIRNRIFPILENLNPSFIRTFSEDMRHIAEVDAIADRIYNESSPRFLSRTDNSDTVIDVEALSSEKDWQYLLYRALEDSGINAFELADLKRAIASRASSGTFAGKTFGPVVTTNDKLILPCRVAKTPEYTFERITTSELNGLKQVSGTIILDADKLPGNPTLRNYREGDWMYPLGMKGNRKKVSDLMTELKWPISRKKEAKVLELDGSHVGALLCERIDDTLRITDSSKNVLRIKERR